MFEVTLIREVKDDGIQEAVRRQIRRQALAVP